MGIGEFAGSSPQVVAQDPLLLCLTLLCIPPTSAFWLISCHAYHSAMHAKENILEDG